MKGQLLKSSFFIKTNLVFLKFRVGVDGANLSNMGPAGRALMTCMPFIMLPFTINFPW